MKNITRKIKFYITNAEKFKREKDGKITVEQLPVLESTKKLSKVALERHFKKFLEKDETVLVKDTILKEKIYTMVLDDFIKNGTEIQEEQAS